VTPPPDGPPPRAGRRMLVRSALAATLIMLATAGASSTTALLKIDDILPDRRAEDRIRGLPPIRTAEPGAPQTLLLLGSDRRWRDTHDDPPHSDTLMLVRIDPGQEATTVLSLPRDLRVAIPGHGVRKINDAYGLGGPALTLETVQQVTGLEINHIVNVNFRGFRRAIDLFDCFYVDVDRRYFHSNAGVPIGQRYDAIDIEPGYQRLCGVDALDYVRYRHTDSDITRAARQQDFLRAAKDQVSTSAVIDDLERLGEVVGRATQTDDDLASKAGFLRFAKLALATADAPVRQIRFPARFVEEDDAAYVEASPAAIERCGGSSAAVGRRRAATPTRRAGGARAAAGPRSAALPAACAPPGSSKPARAAARRWHGSTGATTRSACRCACPATSPSAGSTCAGTGSASTRCATAAGRCIAPTGSCWPRTRSTDSSMVCRARPGAHRRCSPTPARPGGSRAVAWSCSGRASAYASSPGARIAPPTGSRTPSA
jgi:LCP family protein required for cell wall assembly